MASKIQVSEPTPGGLSSWTDSPLRHLTRLCIIFLQKLFESAPEGWFHWVEDDEHTEVIITKDMPIDTDVIHKRPVIVVVRSPVGWQGLGHDQLLYESMRTGERSYADMISGNLTFNCLARTPDESEVLAWLVSSHVWLLRRVLMKSGFHDIGQRMQIGAVTPPGQLVRGSGKEEVVNVPAFTTFQFGWGARVLEEDVPILDKIQAELTATAQAAYRPTNQLAEGGFGTALVQGDGNLVQFQNIKGSIRPPSIAGRPAQVTQVLGSSPGEPSTQRVDIEVEG